ncbi:MAG: AraD1 family protein [Pseudomonadota bacterium]
MTDTIRTIQFRDVAGQTRVGLVEGDRVRPVKGPASVYALAQQAIAQGTRLRAVIEADLGDEVESYDRIAAEHRLLPPAHHPDGDARFLITGTGLTHIGSATTRNDMHDHPAGAEPPKTDSMKLFEAGLRAGKPGPGQIGAMPEWFFKGDGSILVPPGQPLSSPNFARTCAEEPEITGIYIVGPDGTPFRIGHTLANDLSDHEAERLNFMYVAPSKLRDCAMGPELLIGDLPQDVRGHSRIWRDGRLLWEGVFQSGEANMSYSIANLEHHHFRYPTFRRPGDLHAHLFGCPVISFGDGIRTEDGDVFEFDVPVFGHPLRNPVRFEAGTPRVVEVAML